MTANARPLDVLRVCGTRHTAGVVAGACPASAEPPPSITAAALTYTYDGPLQDQPTDHTAPERGPPVVPVCAELMSADDLGSLGALAPPPIACALPELAQLP